MKMFFNHRLSRTTLTNVRVGGARTPAALDTPILAWRLFDGTNSKRKLLIMLVCMLCVCSVNATTWYVDATNGSDANTGTSSETALATIQSAVDKASERDTVLVGSGIYVPSSTSKYGVVNSDKKITIKSQNGYASTIIDAQNQMCCLYGGGNYNHTNCVLVGFSLINGRSPSNFNMGGAAIGGTVINCVVSNCFARSNAGAGHFTRFVNCLLTRNWTTEGYASVAYSSELINCTIVGNYVSGSLAGGQCAVYNCTLRNCILWKNLSSGNSVVTTYGICTTSNCCTSDPRFKDEAIGDYRLTSDSPCVNTGDDSFVRWDTDLAGNIRNNGTVDIGAYEYYPVELSLKGITAKQRYPWNGKVDVQFKLETSDSNNCVVMLFAKDVAGGTNLPMRTVYKLDGSAVNVSGELVPPGTYHWVWDAAADLPKDFKCERVTVTASLVEIGFPSVTDGLVAWWSFNGNVNDNSGNGHHLTGDSLTWDSDRNGCESSAAIFSGSLTLRQTTELNVSNSMTFACWVKPSTTLNIPSWLGINLGVGNFGIDNRGFPIILLPVTGDSSKAGIGFSVAMDRCNVLARASYNNDPCVIMDCQCDLSGGWHHVVITINDNGNPLLYVDGIMKTVKSTSVKGTYYLSKESSVGGGVFASSEELGYGKTIYKGELDDLCIYNRSLSESEVKSLYNSSK